jgi:hypothetical protein
LATGSLQQQRLAAAWGFPFKAIRRATAPEEPDVDSPAGPQLAAPTARPDFQQDDQAGAAMNPQAEGANPSPSTAQGANEMPQADADRAAGKQSKAE